MATKTVIILHLYHQTEGPGTSCQNTLWTEPLLLTNQISAFVTTMI